VRILVLNDTQRVIAEPEALQLLLGGSLPGDVAHQLKVRYIAMVPNKCANDFSICYTGLLSIQLPR